MALTASRGKSLHKIQMLPITTHDTCVITWISEFEDDCSSEAVENLQREMAQAFEELRQIVEGCQRISETQA